jgi:DNA-binding MarR family transcriptional regulator
VTVIFNLMRVANRIGQDFERSVHRKEGSSRAAFRVMFSLWVFGPANQRDLARLSHVTAASISSILTGMEEDGIVRRTRDNGDRRVMTVELTPLGLRKIKSSYRAHHARERQWADALSPAELELFSDILHRLVTHRPDAEPAGADRSARSHHRNGASVERH